MINLQLENDKAGWEGKSRSTCHIGQEKYWVKLCLMNYLHYFSLLNLSKHSTCIKSTPGVLTVYCKIKYTIVLSWNI
jgi:hypothetical protein